MIEITDKEFEQIIEEQILRDGKPLTKIVKELKTEMRTFYNKVLLLSESNPELYIRFVEKYPYKPREITGISIRNIIIEFLEGNINIGELAKKYNMGIRTLTRKVNEFKNSKDPEERELYELYHAVAFNHSHSRNNSIELNTKIAKYSREESTIKYDDKEKRKQYLINIEREYANLCLTMSVEEALKKIGITRNRMYKLMNELYRIEIEDNAIKQNSFKNGLKVKNDGSKVQVKEKSNDVLQTENERE